MAQALNTVHPRHEKLWSIVKEKIQGDDLAHDAEHVLRVYRWCLRLAKEAGADPELAGAAGLIHDLVNIPKESADRPLGSELSAVEGAEILPLCGYTEEEVAQIIEGVRTCSWSRGLSPTNPIGETLQNADRLDAIGAIGIMRNIACAQAMRSRGNPGTFYQPDDLMGVGGRELNDREYAIDHFHIKLLKLKQGMTLPTAKRAAEKRHRFLTDFLEQLENETRFSS